MQQIQGIKKKEKLQKEFKKVKAGLILKGTNFYRFCSENGIHRGNAEKAFNGKWNGEKAEKTIQRLIDASKGKTEQ